jgi:hypothetical protein
MNGLDKFPVPNHLIKEGKLNDFLLPQRGYTVDELETIKQQRREREKQALAAQEKEERERRNAEEFQFQLKKSAEAMIPAMWNAHSVSNILSNAIVYSHNPSTITKPTAFVGKTILAEKFKRGDFSSASIRKVIDIINIIENATPEMVSSMVPPLTSVASIDFLNKLEPDLLSEEEGTGIIADTELIGALENALSKDLDVLPDSVSFVVDDSNLTRSLDTINGSNIDVSSETKKASSEADVPVGSDSIRIQASDSVSIGSSSSVPYNATEEALNVLAVLTDNSNNESINLDENIIVPLESDLDSAAVIEVPESTLVDETARVGVTVEECSSVDIDIEPGLPEANVILSESTVSENAVLPENDTVAGEVLIQTDSSDSQMSIQEYVEKVAKILEAEREELWETTAILNAPPGADSVEVPVVEKISVPTLTSTIANPLPPGVMNVIEVDEKSEDVIVIEDAADPLAALEMDTDPLAVLEMDTPVEEDMVSLDITDDFSTLSDDLISIITNNTTDSELDSLDDIEHDQDIVLTTQQEAEQNNDLFPVSANVRPQVEELTVAEIAEIQKEEEERIETEAILNAPPAAESVDFQRKLALMEESMSKIDDDEEWETEAILNAPPAAESLDFPQNNKLKSKTASETDDIGYPTKPDLLSAIEILQVTQTSNTDSNDEESTISSVGVFENPINEVTNQINDDIAEVEIINDSSDITDSDLPDVSTMGDESNPIVDAPDSVLQSILKASPGPVLTPGDSTPTKTIADNAASPKTK